MSQEQMTVEQRRLLGVVLVPLLSALLSVSIVNVVLPSVQSTIGASNSALQWVLAGYTLSFGVLLVPAGRAGDVYGRGRLFIAGLALFGLGSLIAGLAPNVLVLNLARVGMGLGSGLLNPQTVGLIQQYFAGKQRGVAFGMFGATVGVSVAIGPVLGGVLIALLGAEWGWRASFLVNVPIVVFAIVLAFVWFPASAWKALGSGVPDIDPVGTSIFTLAILSVMLPFLQSESGFVYLLLPVGFALFFVWVLWERRYTKMGRQPMVDMALFRTPSFASGALLILLYFTGVTSVWVLVAMFLQRGHGFTAFQAGMIGLPAAVLSIFTSRWAGSVVFKYGRKLVVFGIAVALVGLLGTAAVVMLSSTFGISIWWMMLPLTLIGGAQGTVISPNQTLSLNDVPLTYAGSAGGVIQAGQRLGTAVGIASITGVFFAFEAAHGWDGAFALSFGVIAVIVVLAGSVGVYDMMRPRSRQ